MGLAERFKNRLDQRDIFSEEPVQASIDKTTTTPETNTINPIKNILNSEPEAQYQRYEFEDLETQIIDKIRKTPYWQEYSIQKQENMITKYINKKRNQSNPITASQKTELINNIMILANKV